MFGIKFILTNNFAIDYIGCRITTPLELYYEGINYTSATFAAACTNALPAMTFILAVLFR